ncbi:MAG: poly-beta-1,6 N-acetyl-D-glucosamine export porin PgaA [Alphaproteobacteria bacterium]|nr:poly-beta-1,6 N-acetyl-D-glucosamine export porin PgaA [Alphaproteobacteria bacterium]
MSHRMKIKQVHGAAAAVVVLGGLLITNAAFAQANDVVSGTASPENPVSIGTAMGSTVANGTEQAAPAAAAAPATTAADQEKNKQSTAARILDAISKHPNGREAKVATWKVEQDKAVNDARAGHYDLALPELEQLHKDHPQDLGISSDYAAILGWAGRDADAVAAYKALPEGPRPDYLIDSVGHSYRNLHQPEDALAVYRLGLQTMPDNQSFVAGEILSLSEAGHNDEAMARAQEAANKFALPTTDLLTAIKTVDRAAAVAQARNGHYTEALKALADLHAKYPDDAAISGDEITVLSWAGRDSEAVALYTSLPEGQPDYVLDAAAHSYRNLHRSQDALDLYRAALDKSPDNVTYAVGVIYSLADLGRSNEALSFAKDQLAKHPEKPAELVKAYSYVERHRAIDMARAGHYKEALALLRELRAKYPSDVSEQMDYIAVSSWAGHDADAVKEYKKIAKKPMPDYVLEAVGHSYRALHQSEKALVVYRRGLKQSPRNEVFAAGEIRCLDDLGRYEEGLSLAKKFTARYGNRLEVLLAGGEAANFAEEPVDALNFYQHAAALAPRNHEALRGLIHSEDRSGAPQLALRDADKHHGLMNGKEYRSIIGDMDASLVRWGPLEPASESTRYAETDHAIAVLDKHIATWSALNDSKAYPDILRARFDRLTALRDRNRMQDVVDSYNELAGEGVEVPAYALEPVGDAYLYLRQPEIARDIFLKVLETDPNNYEARRLLAYAYLECEQYDESYATIDKLVADEPKWIYLKNEPERQPNPEFAIANVDAGEIRSYANDLKGADERLTPIVEAGPFDARNRAAAGALYLERGLPRKAMQEFLVGRAIQDGHDVSNETGVAQANLALQNFKEASDQTAGLMQRFPENLGVQRASRDIEIYNMAEIDAHAGYNFAPTGDSGSATNSPHGQGYDVGVELYSSPINYNWRLFAGEDFAHEHQPNDEGIVDYSRSNAGVEYRNGDVTASIAPTFNSYRNGERVGLDGKAHYAINDMWTAGIAAELFSGQTPLRALGSGVTADMYDVNFKWRQDESREVSFDAYAMPFSDGNFRTAQGIEYIEQLYADPLWRLEGEVNLASSQNNKDENRLYYNPSLDFTAMAGLRLTNTLYHRYETLWEHSLLAMPGLYAQQHYDTSAAWLVRYEHRVHFNDTLNAGAGVNYQHQNYDGAAEDAVSLTMDVTERF